VGSAERVEGVEVRFLSALVQSLVAVIWKNSKVKELTRLR
jgi:hypothetical protein